MKAMKKEDEYFIFDKPRIESTIYKMKYIVTKAQCVYYRIIKYMLRKKASDEKKYYVSICGIFKDEELYLEEWIDYHKTIGVDHIYLYNNNSSDNYMRIIKKYIDTGFVELIDWPYNYAQMEAYRDCFNKFRSETAWLGFIDIDEFVVPVDDENIKEFFKKHQYEQSILIYWKMFGSNGLVHRDVSKPVIRDFTSCWPKYDDIGKCFVNTIFEISDKQKIFHHMLWTGWGGGKYASCKLLRQNLS